MDEDMICPRCKHETLQPHMHYVYIDWWECDWCGYSTDQQERIFTANETKRESEKTMGKKNKTIDMVAAKLRERADDLYNVYKDPDYDYSNWMRDYAHTLWVGYKDAADFVSNLKEEH